MGERGCTPLEARAKAAYCILYRRTPQKIDLLVPLIHRKRNVGSCAAAGEGSPLSSLLSWCPIALRAHLQCTGT
ncbi:hypothetical protein BJV78DRAFT_1196511 [Lactifluus subvellereus]|nr:hypothetical protein BJV78DRAFT_1196511 [Lactifluus subvellereus]